ncbi:hypothetical protein ACFL6T_04135 [Candidatus Zixiibacteriota bacterium]
MTASGRLNRVLRSIMYAPAIRLLIRRSVKRKVILCMHQQTADGYLVRTG